MKLAVLRGFQGNNDIIINCLPFTIGRCKSANFIIFHVNVSRNHCCIMCEDSKWKIQDFSSSGTFLNNSLIGKGCIRNLQEGDSLRFGSVENNLSCVFYSSVNKISVNSYEKSLQIPNEGCEEATLLKEIVCVDSKRNADECLKHYSDINLHSEEINSDTPILEKSNTNEPSTKFLKPRVQNEERKTTEDCHSLKFEGDKSDAFVPQPSDNITKYLVKVDKENYAVLNGTKFCDFTSKGRVTTQELQNELSKVKDTLNEIENKNIALEEKLKALINKGNENELSKSNVVNNFTDLLETELQCTICSELFLVAVTLGCTHSFCQFCLNQWKLKQKTCPICRKKIITEARSIVLDNYIDKVVEQLSAELKKRRQEIIQERKQMLTKKPKRRRL